ncbi:hypothetical protein J19TS2_19460 [Cohnella xylanilytica]|nr:hypothetical protein J19TS2_19460 [Cohnella xylanilytica]
MSDIGQARTKEMNSYRAATEPTAEPNQLPNHQPNHDSAERFNDNMIRIRAEHQDRNRRSSRKYAIRHRSLTN